MTPTGSGDGDQLSVGFMMPFSGSFSSVGNAARKGAALAAMEANEGPGVDVDVTFVDTQGSPEVGLEQAEELLEEGVDALVGFASSAVGLAVAEACRSTDVVLLLTAAQSPEIERANQNAFRVVSDLEQLNAATARVVDRETDGNRVAAVLPDYRFGRETWAAFTAELGAMDSAREFVSAVYTSGGEDAYDEAIRETLAADPDVVYTSLWAGELVAFAERAQRAGLFDAVADVVFGSTVISDVLPALERLGVDAIASTHYYHAYPETPTNEAFVSAFRSEFDEAPADVAQEAYAGVRALCIAAANADETAPTPSAFAAELAGLSFEAPEGEKRIRERDRGVTEETLWVGRLGDSDGSYGFTEMWTVPGTAVSPEE